MQYHLKATVNYPETEVDTPDHISDTAQGVRDWLMRLVTSEPDATSFVVTIVRTSQLGPIATNQALNRGGA